MTGGRAHLGLSGITIEVVSADARLLERLEEIWGEFRGAASGDRADLEVELSPGRAAVAVGPPEAKRVRFVRGTRGGGTFELAEGRVEVGADGRRSSIALTEPEHPDRAWAVHNLLLPALAWSLGEVRRGALVHGAAIVVGGRAFVLVGPEGAGKSTFAAEAARGGADVLGEDLAFLDRSRGRMELLAAPYRTENATYRKPGRWPLAAVLWPRHAPEPAVGPVSRVAAVARLAANLPYLAAVGKADAVADRIVEEVGVAELSFARDPGFVDVLRGLVGPVRRGGRAVDSRQ